jgi:diadenylate cyclase
MVHRIAEEIETMIIELGIDARLLRLQLDELYGEIDDELDLVVADYLPAGRTVAEALRAMSQLSDDEVSNLRLAAGALSPDRDSTDLTQEVVPKGMRLLHRVSRLPSSTAIAVANHFGGLAKLQRATIDDLMAVDDVDEATAKAIRDTLSRVTESTILDQYS